MFQRLKRNSDLLIKVYHKQHIKKKTISAGVQNYTVYKIQNHLLLLLLMCINNIYLVLIV